jgi:phosphoadenosine phosphosulfate reductase
MSSGFPEWGAALAEAADEAPNDATVAFLHEMISRTYAGRIALVSSFGTDSAVLLHLVARVAPSTPVVFVDTGRLFPETLAYRDALVDRLGLTSVRTVGPSAAAAAQFDPAGTLWNTDADLCCWRRKVEPLDAALEGFAAWITGRKRFQGGERDGLPLIEHEDGGRVKLNPLADWTEADLVAYRAEHDLPPHPLEAVGYRSIGCAPCTRPAGAGESARAGRWAGLGKTECGIHRPRPAGLEGVA